MDDITDLIWELNEDADIEKIIDVYPKKTEQREVSVSVEYINKRLGMDFPKEEIESVWKRLNFEYKEQK